MPTTDVFICKMYQKETFIQKKHIGHGHLRVRFPANAFSPSKHVHTYVRYAGIDSTTEQSELRALRLQAASLARKGYRVA